MLKICLAECNLHVLDLLDTGSNIMGCMSWNGFMTTLFLTIHVGQ